MGISRKWIFAITGLLSLTANLCFAQTGTTSVRGTVVDQSRATVAGAALRLGGPGGLVRRAGWDRGLGAGCPPRR